MSDIKVLITGSSGFLGRSLVSNFKKSSSFQVVTAGRQSTDNIKFDLKNPNNLTISEKISAVIHCSYDFSALDLNNSLKLNLEPTLQLYHQAKAAGAKVFIFVSSMTAHENCRSIYGLTKLAIEKKLCKFSDVVIIRPGLLYSSDLSEGTLSNIVKMASNHSIIPMIDGGSQPQYITHLDDFFELLKNVIELPDQYCLKQAIFVGDATTRSLKSLIETFRSKKIKTLYLPWWLVWTALRFLELLGFKTKFRSDSVIGLRDSTLIENSECLILNIKNQIPLHSLKTRPND